MAKWWESDPLAQGGAGGSKWWEQDEISQIPTPEPRPADLTPTNIFTGLGMPKLEAATNAILEPVEKYVPGFTWLENVTAKDIPGGLEAKKQLQDQQTGAAIKKIGRAHV